MTKGWIVLIVVAVAIAGGAFYLTRMTGNSEEGVTAASAVNVEQGTGVMKGSMQDLIARGGSWKCEFTHKTDVGDSTGTVYTSGGMVRGNFISRVPQLGEVKSSMIARDTFVYTWSDMMPQGFKMPMSSEGPSATTAGQTNFYEQELDYNCTPWEVDTALFEVPTTMTFVELRQ